MWSIARQSYCHLWCECVYLSGLLMQWRSWHPSAFRKSVKRQYNVGISPSPSLSLHLKEKLLNHHHHHRLPSLTPNFSSSSSFTSEGNSLSTLTANWSKSIGLVLMKELLKFRFKFNLIIKSSQWFFIITLALFCSVFRKRQLRFILAKYLPSRIHVEIVLKTNTACVRQLIEQANGEAQ